MRFFLLIVAFLALAPAVRPIEREIFLMGTSLRVTLFTADREQGIRDTESLVRIVEETEQQLSTWRSDSELSHLNQQALNQPFEASASLFLLLLKLKEWTVATEGAFDPTVGRLIQIWGIHDSFRMPDRDEVKQALRETGFQYLDLQRAGHHVTKRRSVLLDPGAFGKGEALDRVLWIARKNHLGPLLLDFGGQLATNSAPSGSEGWKVSVADPQHRLESLPIAVSLKSGSLSTSGSSERDGFAGGTRIGHILNPATGQPVPAFGSVTVWHQEALAADILSTALYVMGPEKGYDWALRNNVAACFLICSPEGHSQIRKTPTFPK